MPDASLIERAFSAARAEVYDEQFQALRAIKDAIHLLLRAQLGGLPEEARVLVVGAGTGAEVRFLAPLVPGWRFTLVDPAEAMLSAAGFHPPAAGSQIAVLRGGTASWGAPSRSSPTPSGETHAARRPRPAAGHAGGR
jgi:SAM-dependent methyltransferase